MMEGGKNNKNKIEEKYQHFTKYGMGRKGVGLPNTKFYLQNHFIGKFFWGVQATSKMGECLNREEKSSSLTIHL